MCGAARTLLRTWCTSQIRGNLCGAAKNVLNVTYMSQMEGEFVWSDIQNCPYLSKKAGVCEPMEGEH